jgi:hypothetical protein
MTTPNESPLHFTAPRRHALRDLGVVAFLVLVLGAFVAQISSPPSSGRQAPTPTAAAQASTNARA